MAKLKKILNSHSTKIIAVLFLLVFLSLISWRLSIQKDLDNEKGRADPIFNCEANSRYIDVSMCPTYGNYANNENANSAIFFNEIIDRVESERRNVGSIEPVIIKIPSANFYLINNESTLENDTGYINFEANQSNNKNFDEISFIGYSETEKPTFIAKGSGKFRKFMIFVSNASNFQIQNVKFKSDNTNKFNWGVFFIRDMQNETIVDGIECSGVKGTTVDVEGAIASNCMRIQNLEKLTITNSNFSDYFGGIGMGNIKQITIENNLFDNSNPSRFHNRGLVDLGTYGINPNNENFISRIANNTFKQGSGYTEGETAIGVIGNSHKVQVLNNTMYDIQDTGFIIGNHNPEVSTPCLGGPKELLIQGNKFYRTKLNSILLMNNVESLGGCTTDQATMRNILILANESHGGGGSFTVETAPHSPVYGLEMANNIIKDITDGPEPDYWGVLDGTCITLAGLKGESNNYEDIRIHDNRLENCRAGIYLRASHWYEQGEWQTREANYVGGQNRKNEYIRIYNNTIKNDNPEFSGILIQEKPVRGIEDIGRIRFSNNSISNISTTPANGAKRCNASCSVSSECDVPSIQQVYSGLQGTPPNSSSIPQGYPTSYLCSASKCRNASDVDDDNCDLNDANQAQNQAPVVNAGVDQAITLPSSVSLVGTATDDGLPNPPASLTKTWSKVTGAGTVTFSAVNNLNTTASFSTSGAYTLRLSVSDGEITTTDDVIITVNPSPPTGTVANPTFSPVAGTYTSAQTVTVNTTTSGASIRYTTNGTDPTSTTGTIYSGAINITSTTTLKAIAYKDGMNPSSVSSATYTINTTPAITEYNVVGTISFRYDNIPITLTIKNGNTVVKTLTVNSITADNRIEFNLNSNEVGAGNYTVNIKPRYYTAREGTLTLATNQNVTFTVSGEYFAGKYTTTNPDKITILDVSRFLAYFRASDHTKDLNGDGRINILDLVKMLNDFRSTNS